MFIGEIFVKHFPHLCDLKFFQILCVWVAVDQVSPVPSPVSLILCVCVPAFTQHRRWPLLLFTLNVVLLVSASWWPDDVLSNIWSTPFNTGPERSTQWEPASRSLSLRLDMKPSTLMISCSRSSEMVPGHHPSSGSRKEALSNALWSPVRTTAATVPIMENRPWWGVVLARGGSHFFSAAPSKNPCRTQRHGMFLDRQCYPLRGDDM